MAEVFRPSSKCLKNSPSNEGERSFGVLNLENVSDLSNSSTWLFKPELDQEKWDAQATSLINDKQVMPPSDFLNTPCDNSETVEPSEEPTPKASLPKTTDGLGQLVLGAWPDEEEVDQSIHEVHFGENELEQFEAEFSDLGEDSDPDEHNDILISCPNDGQMKQDADVDASASASVLMKFSDDLNHSCDQGDDKDTVNDLSPERARKDVSLTSTCGVSSTTQTLLDSVYFQPAHGDDTGLNPSILDHTDAVSSNPPRGSNMFDIPLLEKNKFENSAGGSMIDLAYHMFSSDFSDMPAIPTTKDISGLNEDEFVSGDKMMKNLEDDAADFEKENASIRDLPMSGGSQSQDFSGICHSFISRQSTSELGSSFLHTSVGGVIASRTEALGALDGNAEVRPHFGTTIVTPPSNRRPPVLLSESFIQQTSGRMTDVTDVGEQIQASGVSSEVDQTGFDHDDGADDVNCSHQVRDHTLTTDDLTDAHDIDATPRRGRVCNPETSLTDRVTGTDTQAELVAKKDDMPPPAPPNDSQQARPGPDNRMERQSWKNGSDTSRDNDLAGLSVDESSGLLNLSTIDKVLQRESVKPQDFIESIKQKSHAKSQTKMRQHSREQRRAVVEATRTLSDSSDVDATKQQNSCANMRKVNNGRCLPRPTRKGVDGKSITQSTKSKLDTSEESSSNTDRAASDTLGSSCESSCSGSRSQRNQSRKVSSGVDQHQLKGNKEVKNDKAMQKDRHGSYSGNSSASEPSSGTNQMQTGHSSVKSGKSCRGSSNAKRSQILMPSPSDMELASLNHSNSLSNLPEQGTDLKTNIVRTSSMQEIGVKMQKSSSNPSKAGSTLRQSDEEELDNRQNTQRLANSELLQSKDVPRLYSRKTAVDSNPDGTCADFEWTCSYQSSTRSSRSSFVSEARDVSLASQKTASTIKDVPASRFDLVSDGSDSTLESRKKTSVSSQPELNGSKFPRHGFHTDYTKPTCDYENDDKNDHVSDKKRDLILDTNRLAADDQIQNSGSYRPPRSTPAVNGFSKKGQPLTCNMLPSQYLDSHLQSSTKPPSTGLTQYSGPFKVPQPPESLFTSRSSLSFASPPPATEEPSFNISVSSQQPMDDTHSETRLFNNRDSIPGEPSNQSTPFYHLNHTKANTRHFQCLSSLAETPGNSVDNHKDDIPLLVVPNEIRIPGVCCINLSSQGHIPVKNISSLWLNLSIEMNNLTMDGKEHFPHGKFPFIYEKRVFLAPFASEDIRVLFAPLEAGTYTAQLQFVSNSAAGHQSSTSRVVTLTAVAEMPSIEVYTESDRGILDFGSLPWGREKQMKLTLINKGRANIPIRLVISSIHSAASCFSFSKHSSTNISPISRQVCPGISALKPTIINLLIPGLEDGRHDVEPVDTIIYFRSPDRQPDKASLAAEMFLAALSIELDTPYSMISLGSIRLQASVGVARLHTPACYETVTLKTSPGQAVTLSIPLKNAGNIPANVSLEILEQPDIFTVTPMQMSLEIGQVSMFVLKFEPKQTHVRLIESSLLIFVEPDGPGYEIDIHGEILLRPSMLTYPASGKAPIMLLSSRQFLAWGGVPVHSARTETFTLRNATTCMMQILLEIQDTSSQFKLVTKFGETQTLCTSKEFILKPHKDCPVHVIFEPTAVTFAAAKLQIRLKHAHFKFTVPLSGYGGVSQLAMEGVRSNSQSSYWVNLGTPAAGRKMLTVVRICNRGVRPAYVKAAGFEDLNLKRKLENTAKLVIKPNGFCLKENSACDVTIELTPSEKEASLCLERESIMTVVAFFHGDELSRQLYRHALRNHPEKAVSLPVTSPVEALNFDTEFIGDDLIPKDMNVKMTTGDVDLFYTSMKYLTLSLVGSPVFGRPLTAEREGHLAQQNVVEENNTELELSSDMNQWLIQPETLTLTIEETDVCPRKKLQIINYMKHELSFDLSASAPFITVTPDHVIVKARNYILISIIARPDLIRHSVQLPWSGAVSVTCQQQTKNISVLVRDAEAMPISVRERPVINSQAPVSVVSPTNQSITPLIAIATPNTNNIPSRLRLTQHKLTFRNVRILDTAEQFIEIRNISSHIIRWNISSFIPPYLKSPTADGKVIKMSYSVFSLPRVTGLLDPHQSAQVRVTFTPRELGQHSQFWEIKATVVSVTDVGNNLTHICKLELEGQCVAASGATAVVKAVQPVGVPSVEQSSGRIMCRSRVLTVSTGVLHFTVDFPGSQQQKKIKIGNRSKEVIEIIVIPPANPFHVKTERCEVKPRHYMNFPIIFYPQAEGFFEARLSLQKPSGELLTLKLTGVCLDRH